MSGLSPTNARTHAAAVLLACCLVSAPVASSLILKRADYNQNSLINGKLVSVLRGNVVFLYEDAHITSEFAKWYRSDGRARFSKNVKITQPDQTLHCDNLVYDRTRRELVATGTVNFFSHTENTRIQGERAVYSLETGNLKLDREPRLIRYDTLSRDTMVITGGRMRYDDSLRLATAIDSVRITKGKLTATSSLAYYNTEKDAARLRITPDIYYGIHHLTGDSVDLLFLDQRLRGVSVMSAAHAIYREPSQSDTTLTDITGDSLYMAITEQGSLDTIWVFGNTRSTYHLMSEPGKVNEARGKRMIIAFRKDGEAKNLEIAGNAESVYYVDDESETGRNEASGDRIYVIFDDGRAAYLKLTGAVRGIYFAHNDATEGNAEASRAP
jgi:lipopolysaccharide export system protein LptA